MSKTPIGVKLYRARQRIKDPRTGRPITREVAVDAANDLLPERYQFAYVTLTRIENGAIKEPGMAIVAALANVYKQQLKDFDIDLRDDAAQLAALYERSCAPWESNPEPADFPKSYALAA